MIARLLFTFLLCQSLLWPQIAGSRPSLDSAQKAEQSGDLPKAELIYEEAVAGNPNAELYQRLGLVRHLQNKFPEAAKAFEKALKLNTTLWTSHLFLGIDLYRMNRFSDALVHLKSADQLHPHQPETRFWLGATYLALRQYWEGFEDLEVVLEKDASNVDALRLLAEAYADQGTQLLNQIAEKYPESAAGLQVQGNALEFEGSYEQALECYRKAAAKDPTRTGLQEAIARLMTAKP